MFTFDCLYKGYNYNGLNVILGLIARHCTVFNRIANILNFIVLQVLTALMNWLKRHLKPLKQSIQQKIIKFFFNFKIGAWGQCYKTFYGLNLQIFVIS